MVRVCFSRWRSGEVKLDSGATYNLLPFEIFERILRHLRRLRPAPKVHSYGTRKISRHFPQPAGYRSN